MIKNLANRLGISNIYIYIYIVALAALIFNTFTNNTYANNNAIDTATITVSASCSMTATVTAEHVATMNGGTYSGNGDYPNGIGSTTMQTFCNDANGYAIYAIGYTNNEEGNTVLKGGAGLSSDYDIVTGTATSGSGSNDISNWAMKVSSVAGTYAPTIVNGFNSFSNIPSSYTAVAKYNGVTDQNTTGSSITTTYAAYISNTQPAGTYTGQVKYILVHPDFDVSTARTMQNIAEWEDELLPGVQVTTVDSRDGSTYNVAKLKDGNIWMLDNLALGSTSPITLTNADTNMTAESWTLPASSTTGFEDFNSSDDYTKAAINTASKTTTEPLAVGQSGTGKIGVYYNYCAASAGTYCMDSSSSGGNASNDICPKGWRLPTGGPSGEFQALQNQYSSASEFALALRTPLSGGFYNGSADVQGSYGYFWSSTFFDSPVASIGMYDLRVSTADVYPQDYFDRYVGFSVRCVRETLPTMQSVTTSELDGLMPNAGDTAILRDSRDDNIYSVSNIDGQYWMTKNLDLAGGTTLTPEDSNVTSSYTLPTSSTDGFNDDTKAFVYNSGSTTCGDESPCYSYYSYVAATAGTNPSSGNATSDICPKGWRLPTQAEYNSLISTYTTGATLTASPWLGVYAGYYNRGSFYGDGSYGRYWSSTAYNSTYAYILDFSSSDAYVYDGYQRYGYPVRCVKIPAMQDITSSQLSTMMPNAGDTTTLLDARDGQTYTVGKLADGNYWMLDNLALGFTSPMTLTSANTNMTAASWTLPTSTTTGFDSSTGYTTAAINTESKDTTQALAVGQSGTGKIGVYYNYCAASAGTYCADSSSGSGNATSDICPKGWRLPTGGPSGEFEALRDQYASKAEYVLALRTPLSGGFYDGSAHNHGGYGSFWSSTYYNATNMYTLGVDRIFYTLRDFGDRYPGFSVRCVKQ